MRSAPISTTPWSSATTACSNSDGLRYPDEFVRHKALDALGDLALAGAPLLATYRSVRGGHKLNHAVLIALMADRSAWTMVEGAGPPRRAVAMPKYPPDWRWPTARTSPEPPIQASTRRRSRFRRSSLAVQNRD